MGKNSLTDIATYAFIVAGILVLTRPGSQGASFAVSLGRSVTGLVQGASGQPVTAFGTK